MGLVRTLASTTVSGLGIETWQILIQLKYSIQMFAILRRKLLIIAAVRLVLYARLRKAAQIVNGLPMTISTPAHGLQILICFV
jgi:hypothetical protein